MLRPSPITAAEPQVPPRSPGETIAATQLMDGYEMKLVAAEPLVRDPVAIAWGPDGKLWVVEMADYPYGIDGKMGAGSRIRWLEDIDGDGVYDRSVLFLDKVHFPNGIAVWRNGVVVTAAPEIFYAEDTDGDGRADVRKTLFAGFAQDNPQLRINGLRWGLDNYLHCANGIRDRGDIRSVMTGQVVNMAGRDVRIHPDTGDAEALSGHSQFGRNRSDYDDWFGVDNSHPLFHYVMEDRYLRRNPHVPPPPTQVQLVLPPNPQTYPISRFIEFYDHPHRGKRLATSTCSGMIYRDTYLFDDEPTAANVPGLHGFTCEPYQNVVLHHVVRESGVTFTAERAKGEEQREFMASSDNWFSPVMVRTGPDGALWVVDFYRYLIEHPEYMPPHGRKLLEPVYRAGEDRGRIYRIVRKDAPPRAMPRLGELTTGQLVEALDTPNGEVRDMAHQLLVWRNDKAAVEPLQSTVKRHENPLARLHALCALDGMGELGLETVEWALVDEHPGVRRQALRLAESRVGDFNDAQHRSVLERATRLVADRDAKVRLQLACTLGQWPTAAAGEALGRLVRQDVNEPYIIAAALSSALPHLDAVVDAALAAAKDRGDDEHTASLHQRLLATSLATGNRAAAARLLMPVMTAEADAYTPRQFAAFEQCLTTLSQRRASLEDLAKTDDELGRLAKKAGAMFEASRLTAMDEGRAAAERVAAVRLLGREAANRDADVQRAVKLLSPRSPSEVQSAAAKAVWRAAGGARAAELLLDGWAGHAPALRQTIVDDLVNHPAAATALLKAIESGRVVPADLDAARRDRLVQHRDEAVKKLAAKVFDAPPQQTRQSVVEAHQPALTLDADPARGKAVFAKACAICHQMDGVGQPIGPDLRAVTDRSPPSLLISILDPNRAVEPRFTAYVAALADNDAAFGVIAAETASSITLVGLDGQTRTILRANLQSLQSTGRSLMPEALEQAMTMQELADLLAYLSGDLPHSFAPVPLLLSSALPCIPPHAN